MVDKTELTKLLDIFVSTIKGMNSDQLNELLLGRGRLVFEGPRLARAAPQDHNLILSRLNAAKSREEAREILGQLATREALASVAKSLKVHVVKSDRKEDIESKIVEFMIGGKLRAEAIRSLNLKAGGQTPSKE